MLRSGPEMHLSWDSPGTLPCPALPCRAAHPFLPALTSPHGPEEQRLEPMGRSGRASFLTPLASGNGEDGRELGLFGCRVSPRCPLSRRRCIRGPFPPSGMASQLLGLGGVLGPGLREAGRSQLPGRVSSDQPRAYQGAGAADGEVRLLLAPGLP